MASLTPAYGDIKKLRSTGDCAGAMAMLQALPPASDEDAFEAVVCLFVCGEIANALHVARSHAWKLDWARQITAALSESFQDGSVEQALAMARKAVRDPDAPCDAAAIYLLLLQQANRLDEAGAYIANRLQNVPAGESFLLTVIAEIALAAGKWPEAYRAACGVLAADAHDYRALLVMSVVNYQIGNIHESLGNAVRANVLRKGSPAAVLQLMRCRNDLGNHYAAIAAFDTLAGEAAGTPDIRVELGRAYRGLRDYGRAVAEFRTALAAGPRPVEAIRALVAMHAAAGETHELKALVEAHRTEVEADVECMCSLALEALNRGELDQTARLFKETLALGLAAGEPLRDLPWPVPEPRIRHDREQLELLARRGKLDASGREALALLARYSGQAGDPDTAFAPAGAEGEALKRALCTSFHVPEAPFEARALGANDYEAIEDQYRARRLVVIDDFLSPEALAVLRRYCEEATVWKMNYARGYVGALLAQGFSPRVLLAIARELKAAMPRVLGEHPLMQAWAFKYDQRMHGIDMHADFAEVNVNFWITPDAACEDPTTGGLVVYDVPVPKHWTFFEYNNESEKLAAYVKVHKANAQRVPYRANRCVLFDSSLVHITDEIHFKPGYENRRVNVTLLYGTPRNTG